MYIINQEKLKLILKTSHKQKNGIYAVLCVNFRVFIKDLVYSIISLKERTKGDKMMEENNYEQDTEYD